MIQRIQSFLLVLAVVGAVLCCMFPVAVYTTGMQAGLYLFPHHGEVLEYVCQTNYLLTVLNLLVGIIALVSIFLYKNRVLQMRVVTVDCLLSVIYLAVVFLWAVDAFGKHIMPTQDPTYSIGAYIPMVNTLLLVLAQRAIRRDEMKVRAADRIR